MDSRCLRNRASKCTGKYCNKIGQQYLQIKYIKKCGWFCDSCAEDLMAEDLVILEPVFSTGKYVEAKIKET
jgi:hypothetical protein